MYIPFRPDTCPPYPHRNPIGHHFNYRSFRGSTSEQRDARWEAFLRFWVLLHKLELH